MTGKAHHIEAVVGGHHSYAKLTDTGVLPSVLPDQPDAAGGCVDNGSEPTEVTKVFDPGELADLYAGGNLLLHALDVLLVVLCVLLGLTEVALGIGLEVVGRSHVLPVAHLPATPQLVHHERVLLRVSRELRHPLVGIDVGPHRGLGQGGRDFALELYRLVELLVAQARLLLEHVDHALANLIPVDPRFR